MTAAFVDRLPFGPLAALANIEQGELAERAGLSRRSVTRWVAEGVPVFHADTLAVAAGFTPQEVWGQQWNLMADALAERRVEREDADYRTLRRKLKREWPWPDEMRVRKHRCASDGCRCERTRVAS